MRGARFAIIGVSLLGLSGCGANWGWYAVSPADPRGMKNLSFMVDGFVNTITVSAAATVTATVLGLVVAILGLLPSRLCRMANRAHVELLRATPPLVLILWVFYGLPIVLDIRVSIFWAALVAIGVCDSAFQAEIFRGGIQSIEQGQRDAAKALGLTGWQQMRLVILPQAIRRVLPPLANQFVTVVKLSSLASVIGYEDLTRRANELVVTVFRPLEIYTVLIVEYLVLVMTISYLVRRLERRLSAGTTRG